MGVELWLCGNGEGRGWIGHTCEWFHGYHLCRLEVDGVLGEHFAYDFLGGTHFLVVQVCPLGIFALSNLGVEVVYCIDSVWGLRLCRG